MLCTERTCQLHAEIRAGTSRLAEDENKPSTNELFYAYFPYLFPLFSEI